MTQKDSISRMKEIVIGSVNLVSFVKENGVPDQNDDDDYGEFIYLCKELESSLLAAGYGVSRAREWEE